MLVDYKYVEMLMTKLGLSTTDKLSRQEVESFLEEDALKTWDTLEKSNPDFFDILFFSGNFLPYVIRHGRTIQLNREMGVGDKTLNAIGYSLIREEYLSQNLFDIHYFQEILNVNHHKFNPRFIEIIYNESNFLFKKLEEYWEENFILNVGQYSKAIEKTISLIQIKVSLVKEAENAGISKNEAEEEARIHINTLINEYEL